MDLIELPTDITEHKNNDEIYKIWSRTKDVSRFLSVKYYAQGKKFIIDIGVTNNSSNQLTSSTSVFVNAVTLLSYIKAINSGNGTLIFPKDSNPKSGLESDESIVVFGGGKVDGNPVARVFKAHYWRAGDSHDSSAFAWKCAHFEARESATGAFIQSNNKPFSSDSIKVTRKQLAEMEILLEAALMKDLTHG